MPIKNVKGLDNLRKSTQAHWDNIREQLEGVTDNDKQAALLEIMALRAMVLGYKSRAEQASLSPLSPKRRNKSFIR